MTSKDKMSNASQNGDSDADVMQGGQSPIKDQQAKAQRQARQLETVMEVSAATATILDLDTLLTEVSNLTRDNFDLYHAHIYLLNEAGDTLELAAGAGAAGRAMKAEGRSIPLSREDSIVATAGRIRWGVIANDVSKDEAFLPHPLLPKTKSEMAVPMIVGETLVGVLDVQADTVDRFTDEDVEVQTALAAQIGIAVQNARTFAKMEQARQELERSQSFLRSIIDATPDWVFAKDRNFRYLLVNETYAKGIGLSPEDMIGKDDIELGFPEELVFGDPEQGITGIRNDDIRALNGEQLQSDFEVIRAGDQEVVFATQKIPLRDHNGLVYGLLGLARDVNEQYQQRIDREVLLEVANQLNAAQERGDVLDAVLGYAHELGVSSANLLYLENDESGTPEWAEVVGLWEETPGESVTPVGTRFYLPDLPFAKLWFSSPDRPLLIEDIAAHPGVDDFTRQSYLASGIRGSVLIPLHMLDRWVGLLVMSWAVPFTFNQRHQDIFMTIGQQATPVVDAIRNAEEVRKAREEAEILYQISTLISEARTEQEVVDIIVAHALLPKIGGISLVLWGDGDIDTADEARIVAEWRSDDQPGMLGLRLPLSNFPLAATLDRHEILSSDNIAEDPKFDEITRASLQMLGTKALISIPLTIGERWLGSMTFTARELRQTTKEELNFLRALSRPITSAVEQMNLNREVQKRAAEIEIVAQVGTQIATNLDVDKLLWSMVNEAKDNFQRYHAHVYTLDEAKTALVLAAGAGEVGKQLVAEGHTIPLDHPNSLVARAARARQVVVIDDVTQAPDFLPNPLLPETKSEMAVPILLGNELMGVLDIQDNKTFAFTVSAVQAKTILASQIAVAMQNARSYQRAQNALAALEVSQTQLTQAVGIARLGYWEFDVASQMFTFNDEFYAIYNTTSKEQGGYLMPIGDYATKFVPPDQAQIVSGEVTRALATADPDYNQVLEHRIIRADGTWGWISVHVYVRMNEAGEVVTLYGVNQDITERKQAEEALQQANLVIENSPTIVFRWRAAEGWPVELVSENISQFGYTAGELLSGKVPYPSLIHPDDLERVAKEVAGYTERGVDRFQQEYRILTKTGEVRWTDDRTVIERDADGNPTHYQGVVIDITQRKQAEAALEINRERLAEAVTAARLGYWQLDVFKQVFTFSDEFYNIFRTTAEEQGGYEMTVEDYVAKFLYPDDAPVVGEEIGRALATTDPDYSSIVEHRMIRADGTIGWISVRINVRINEEGVVYQSYGANQDITERKQAEEALATNQARLSEAVAIAKLGYWELDVFKQMFTFTDEVYELLGTTAEEEGGYTMSLQDYVAKFMYPEDEAHVGQHIGMALAAADPTTTTSVEHRVIRTDGSIGWILVRINVRVNEQGVAYQSYGANQDITEKKLQEQEQETVFNVANKLNNATTYDDVFEASMDYLKAQDVLSVSMALIELDDTGTPMWMEIAASYARPGSQTEAPGVRYYLPDVPLSRLWIRDPDHVLLIDDVATNSLMDDVTRQIYQAYNIVSSAVIPFYVAGRWAGLLIASWDRPTQFSQQDQRILETIRQQAGPVLDLIKANQEIEQRAAELQTVAQVSATAATNLDLDTLLQEVTDLTKSSFDLYHAHIYLFDEDSSSLVLAAGAGEAGRLMKERQHHIPLDHTSSIVARCARTRQGVIVNNVMEAGFLPNPMLPDTRAEMAVPMVVGGMLIGVLDMQSARLNRFTDEDVRVKTTLADQIAVAVENARAYQRQLETADRLREVDRLKSEFLANMSHELRTPLNSIIGYSEVLLDGIDGELTEDAVEDVKAIHGSGQHLLYIINDILDLAKIEAQQMQLDREPVDVVPFVSDVVRAAEILVKNKPVTVELVAGGDLSQVHADPIRLRQIIWNILSNAVKFTEQGSVKVSVERHNDDEALIKVVDTGIGMKEEHLPLVFDQFRQVDGSSTRRAGGTGLGLAITRQLVHMHGGEIFVESELGAGTTFWFTLPFYKQEKVQG